MATRWWLPGKQARWLRTHWVPLLVGGVLLTAACLKAHRLFTDPPSAAGIFEAPWFQVMLVEAEVACGLALWLGVWPRALRWSAMLLFAGFLGAALSQAVTGTKSCSCFGSLVELSPWLAILTDFGLLALLAFWNPSPNQFAERALLACCRRPSEEEAPRVRGRYAAALPIGALLAFPVALFGLAASNAYPRLEVSPAAINLGTVEQGSRRAFALRLRNPHDRPVTIEHVQSSCPCLEASGLPWLVPPGEERVVELIVDLAREPEFLGHLLIDFRGRSATPAGGFSAVAELTVAFSQLVRVSP